MTPQQAIAHYRITSKIGEGGMGAVYRATDTKLNREVAIKVLPETVANDADRMARFTREAQVLASLNHPNIAAIYGVEDHAIVMELVEGDEPRGPMAAEEALPLIHQLIDGLEYAHEQGVVHRDLKPANLKVARDGRLKILDFGLAKAMSAEAPAGDPASSPTLTIRTTMAGMIMGTAAYMSPEQARGHAVDKRADIWSFGVIVYELLTGRRLFEGETISDTLAAVLKTDPDFTAVPHQFRRLLRLCLTRDPHRRLRDISGARLLLEDATERALPDTRRARLWMTVSAILAVALAVMFAIHLRETAPPPEVTRFQVLPPEGGAFDRPWLALSPDGRKLVFSAVAKGGAQGQLWVRFFDSLEARPLPGTEHAMFPFWSPDSRSIGFYSNGTLYRIAASGGPPQILCNAAALSTGGAASGTWSRDGMIYFGAGYSGIFRVSQNGGEASPVVRPSRARGESSYFFPIVLPDGKHLLFHNQTVKTDDFSIDSASVDGGSKKRVITSKYSFGYAPPSRKGEPAYLLLVRQNTLVAQPIDSETLSPSGDAFPLASVPSSITYAQFSVSDNGALAYHSANPRSLRQMTWYDRAGKVASTLDVAGEHTAISRDGTKTATTEPNQQLGMRDIWLIDNARGVPMRFTSGADVTDPVWSPDGARLAFALRTGIPPQLYWKNTNGEGSEERIATSDAADRPCDWSSDGRLLMFTRAKQGTNQIWVVSDPANPGRRTTHLYLESTYFISHCQFSPGPGDPQWVAYTSGESTHGNEVYVQSFPAGHGKIQISNGGGSQPRWRRDGKEIFYLASDGKLMAVNVTAAPQLQVGVPHALFDSGAANWGDNSAFNYDIAPDGRRFLVRTLKHAQSGAPASITVVTNWLAAAKR